VRVIHAPTAQAFAKEAADHIGALLLDDPRAVLALPSGATPLGLYAELARRVRTGSVRLEEARIFNLDEYCGLAAEDPRSFAHYFRRHLVAPLGLLDDQIDVLNGAAADAGAECARYERAIAAHSGLDLCVLGLGANGHIAFNEPGSSFELRTHVAVLAEATRARLEAHGWEASRIPTHGLTLGIGNVLEARRILLLIAGRGKEAAAASLYRGVEDESWPVTGLLRHPHVTVIDAGAPSALP
jgi:glucosamine-6-phosphate deaminase